MILRRGWNEFWGPLLLLRLHRDNPARWSKREERAAWLSRNLALHSGARVLDLGCGDGILDICLSRCGFRVTGVDKLGAVLEAARAEPDGSLPRFEVADLRTASFPPASFDVVLMLDLLGLLSRRDDANLFRSAKSWLPPEGLLVLDCRTEPAETGGQSTTRLDDGVLHIRWMYDAETRLQSIIPEFHMDAGDVIVLDDPYDAEKPRHLGVLRYLYPIQELVDLGRAAGFLMEQSELFWKDEHHLLVGRVGGA